VDNVVSASLTFVRDAPHFYRPLRADSAPVIIGAPPSLTLIVRAAGDPADVIPSVRAAVAAVDPEIAIPTVMLTETAFAGIVAAPRFNMALLLAFAVVALFLAAIGLAAVIGYEIAERTHEIGVRMALGARIENVHRLAMNHGFVPAVAGVVVGVIAAIAATRLAESLLHGVTPRDPLTFGAVIALLVLVAFGASSLAARRATRVEPITALRAQ
jgi:putative ABC transport system permease protein